MSAQETLGIILQTQADIKATVEEMRKGFDDIEKKGVKSAKEVEQSYEESLAKIRNASAIAFAGISAAIGFSTREAIQAEDSLNRVRAAVKLQGGDWGSWKDRVSQLTGSMQTFTRYGDEELNDTLARMIQLTGDVDKSFGSLGIAADLAAALQIDVATAGDMVAKAMQGNLGMLSRYMPALQAEVTALGEKATMSEKAALIMDRLSRFTGAAGEDAQTTGGQMTMLKNQIGEVAESIGNAFLPALTGIVSKLNPVVIGVKDWASEHPNLISAIGIGAVSVTGFLAATTSIALILPKVIEGVKGFTVAMNAMAASPAFKVMAGVAVAVGVSALAWDALSSAMTTQAEHETDLKKLSDELGMSYGELQAKQVQMFGQFDSYETTTNANREAWDSWVETMRAAVVQTDAVTVSIQKASTARGAIAPGGMTAPGIPQTMNIAGLGDSTREALIAPIRDYTQYDLSDFLDTQRAMWQTEQDEEERIAQESFDKRRAMWNENLMSFQAAYGTFTQSILDTDMTGRERANAIWRSFASTAIAQFTRMSADYVIRHLAMKTVAVSTAATEQAAIVSTSAVSTAAGATEQATAISVAVAWMKAAYAKLTAFYAFLGPFAPAAAIGTMAAALAGVAMVTKEALGFAQGGVVPGSGNKDSVLISATPGERILTVAETREYDRGNTGGGKNEVHIHLDRETGTDEILRIRRMVQGWIAPIIEEAKFDGQFRPSGVPA